MPLTLTFTDHSTALHCGPEKFQSGRTQIYVGSLKILLFTKRILLSTVTSDKVQLKMMEKVLRKRELRTGENIAEVLRDTAESEKKSGKNSIQLCCATKIVGRMQQRRGSRGTTFWVSVDFFEARHLISLCYASFPRFLLGLSVSTTLYPRHIHLLYLD